MGTIMKLIVALGMDAKDYEAGLDEATRKTKQASREMGETFSKAGDKLMSVGAGMSTFLTLPIAAAGVASVKAASDLNETMSKVQVVFGDSADSVIAFGDAAAKSLGMSKNDALSAAGTFGNLFVSMGLGGKSAADMSTGLVQLASDLASFNNMDPTEVTEKLRAGLTGETEPLKSLGVNLNAATVEAKALTLGLWDGEGAISAAAKAQATYALVLEQTKTAQGDFARTSDGLANSTRIAKAQLADAAAKLGTQLLPIALQVVQALSKLVDWFSNLSPEVQKTILIIAGIAAVIGPVITIIGGLLSAIGAITAFLAGPTAAAIGTALAAAAPIIGIVLAVIAVVALLYMAWTKDWGGIQTKTKAAWKAIQPVLQTVWDWLKVNIPKAFAATVDAVKKWYTDTEAKFKQFSASVQQVIKWVQDMGTSITNTWNALGKTADNIWSGIKTTVLNAATAMVKSVTDKMDQLDPTWRTSWAKIVATVVDKWNEIKTNVVNAITSVYNTIVSWGSSIINAVANWWTGIASAVSGWWSTIINNVSNAVSGLVNTLKGYWAQIVAAVSSWWTGIIGEISGKWSQIKKTVEDWIANVLSTLKNSYENMKKAGAALIDGVIDGVMSMLSAASEIAARVALAIINALKGALGLSGGKNGINVGGDLTLRAPGAIAALSANSGGGVTNNYNIFAKETPGQISQALTLSALMGGAA